MLKFLGKQRKKKGFTLIELIVVIAILAILAVIAIPRLTGSREKANKSAILANLRSIESAISVAQAEKDNFKPDTNGANLVSGGYLASWPKGPGSGISYSIKQETTGDKPFRAIVNGGTYNGKTVEEIEATTP